MGSSSRRNAAFHSLVSSLDQLKSPSSRQGIRGGLSYKWILWKALLTLHRAAFGTEKMTVELRQAMMNAPQYEMNLDLLAIAPDGSLAGFCICSLDENNKSIGHTDPIGVHPLHQHKGLAKALVNVGISMLAKRGVKKVELGTSSENTAMQQLASSLHFSCYSEKIWFSKNV